MAHEILEHDQMISGRYITPWHKLGEVTGEIDIFDLHRIMGWKVDKFMTQTCTYYGGEEPDNAKEKDIIYPIDCEKYATVRLPRNKNEKAIILGEGLSRNYKVLQNTDLIELVQPFVEQGCAIETAGTLKNGQRVWIMLRLAKDLHVGKHDTIQKYIMVSNDHTGAQAARFGMVGIRVVCMNTLNAAESVHGESQLIRVLHNGDIKQNMELVANMLDKVNGGFKVYGTQLNAMSKVGINHSDLEKYVEQCLFVQYSDRRKEERAQAIKDTTSKIVQLFETGAGSDMKEAKGTVYGAYQAVNNYLNHNREIALETRLPSLIWGSRAVVDRRAFNLALKLAA